MNHKSITRFLIETLPPFKGWIIAFIILNTLIAFDVSIRPYIFKIIMDRLVDLSPEKTLNALLLPVIAYLAMSVIVVINFRFQDYTWLKLNPPLKRHLGLILMDKMTNHSQSLFQDHFAGALGNRVKDVMSSVPDLLKLIIAHPYNQCITLFFAIITVWTINFRFALLLTTWIVLFIIMSYLFSKRARKLSRTAAEIRTQVVGQIVDILSNVVSIHLFSTRAYESKKLRKHLDTYVKTDQKRDWFFLKMNAALGSSFVIYQGLSLFLLIQGSQEGMITPGDFALILTINISIITCLWALSDDITKIADLTGNIEQGIRIAFSPRDIKDMEAAKPLSITQGKIVFDRVKFHYKNTDPLFQEKSVTIPGGQKVGLVGYSGGGKTTFVNLILRLYDVRSGRILIDDQDIRHVTLSSLRTSIGMIPQDPSLFHRSIMDNIRYGHIDATDEQIIEAARQANAHDFITKLPNGYNTLVGERGIKLSGGQRQRIAIARAILKNAPILILDEATSQLDSITESDIQDSLWKCMQGKTTIIIAHRLSTLLHMDRILVFDKGKIIEDGSHRELLALNGLYKTLWDAQVGGFIP